MPVTANLDAVLDKEWENKSLAEVLKAPVSALAGVSDGDAAALQRAFRVKTVGDLGRTAQRRTVRPLGRRVGRSRPGTGEPTSATPELCQKQVER
jgi:hypothetical protein